MYNEDLKRGDRVGKLTVLCPGEDYIWRDHHYRQWWCQCDCGKEILTRESKLKAGGIYSCGCQRKITIQNKEKKVLYEEHDDGVACTLTNGVTFWISSEDYDKVKIYGWSYNGPRDYIFSNSVEIKYMPLSRYLMDCPADMEVDHIDHDRLNNRRSNLRIVTSKQNMANTGPRAGCSSQYKGVSFCLQTGKWKAFFSGSGVNTTLGRYELEEDAAIARDIIAYRTDPEHAWLNFPEKKDFYHTVEVGERWENIIKKCREGAKI